MAKVANKIRSREPKDTSPVWTGCETWDANQFFRNFHNAMTYYRLEFNGKDLKPAVIKWMTGVGCTKEDIQAFKKTKDNRCTTTMGAIASCLLRGMPSVREDFNDGKDTAAWLRQAIVGIIEQGKNDVEDEEVKEVKPAVVQPSIQERVREASLNMTEEIEDALESFIKNPESFDPKAFKILNLLKGKQAKAAHARVIKDFYKGMLEELEELATGEADEQLREGYSHLARKNVRKLMDFLKEIEAACGMLAQEAKVNRKPKARKSVPAEKIVAKLKYKKSDEPLKLVSINPTDIIGAKELWVYNIKTRKLGKYEAAEFSELSVKGTSITNFNPNTSVCKTLRKPEEKLKEFKAAGKVQLRKFLDSINATDTKLNGRINEEIILLRVQS